MQKATILELVQLFKKMIIMNRNYLIYILVLSLFSCNDFLDVKPKAEIVEYKFFETKEGYEDALYGAYSALSSPELHGGNLSWGLLDQFSQYYKVRLLNDNISAILSIDHEHQGLRAAYDQIWSKSYEIIGITNNILRHLKEIDVSEMRYYNLYKGEALGLRALLHFDLLRLFAPQVTSKPNATGIPYVEIYKPFVSPFKNTDEVYRLIIRDLKEAEELLIEDESLLTYPRTLEINKGFGTAREIHFNLYASQALLARVYWMMGDLENAAVYAKKVIDSGLFPLEDKLNMRKFVAGTISEKETIFGINSTNTLSIIERMFYVYEPTRTWVPADDNNALYSVPLEYGNDMRGNNWFRILIDENNTDDIVRCMKIVNEAKIRDPGTYKSSAIEGVNLIRIPEMYLIMAESLLLKDPITAQSYFDTFIVSRGLFKYSDRPGNPTLTLEDIIKERRKEFVQEGQYFYVLKKYNLDIEVIPLNKTLEGSTELYTFLIPDDEFEFRYDK